MRYHQTVRQGLRLPSGRVISVGRLMLATLFLMATWLDSALPVRAPAVTYSLLTAYAVLSAVLAVVTWRDWWLDARLAGPAHALDIALFTLLVFAMEGYTSAYFTFFMFILLAAAIRWGWRATALTAMLVTLLYLLAAQLVANAAQFELQPFVMRTGQLVILSLILIWFGINQWRVGAYATSGELPDASLPGEDPLQAALKVALAASRARRGLFAWRELGTDETTLVAAPDGEPPATRARAPDLPHCPERPFLYHVARDRALCRDDRGNLHALASRELIGEEAASELGLHEGVAIPVRTGSGEGELFLEQVADLSTDHLELAEQVAADVAGHLQRHALLKAAEEGAESRSRLTLARDLHDSVVQFLAGAAFRLEAMKRSQGVRDLQPELDELKQLMLQEQGELRGFIAALRDGSHIGADELARDLGALAERLSRQWDVLCDFSAKTAEFTLPTRLQLDAQHLVREAVANAVRHAGAKSVSIRLDARPDELRLDFINDGARYPSPPTSGELPRSMRERVELAGGVLDLTRGMGVTKISVCLPTRGRSQ